MRQLGSQQDLWQRLALARWVRVVTQQHSKQQQQKQQQRNRVSWYVRQLQVGVLLL